MTGKKKTLLYAALLLLVGGLCYARVYVRVQGSSTMSDRFIGMKTGYTSEITINGGRGRLEVIQWNMDFERALDRLHGEYFSEGRGSLRAGDDMAFGLIKTESLVTRFVLISLPARCMVFRIDQSPEEFEASRTLPDAGSVVRAAPPYPGSELKFCVENDDTGTRLEISRAFAGEAAVDSAMCASLENNGWTTPFNDPASHMKLYVRDSDICCMLVSPGSRPGESMLTLLEKKQNN